MSNEPAPEQPDNRLSDLYRRQQALVRVITREENGVPDLLRVAAWEALARAARLIESGRFDEAARLLEKTARELDEESGSNSAGRAK